MTIFNSNSIFQTTNKLIKVGNDKIKVINGANTLADLPLCGIKIDYEQYQRISVQIPKGETDFLLSFPMLGLNTTFITIVPTYKSKDPSLNYLRWKFQASSEAKLSMTSILVLTGTVANPVQNLLIDNPNSDCIVQLEILVSAMDNDFIADNESFLYLDNLTFDKIHTYNETNTEILAFFNQYNELVSTVDVVDVVNVNRIYGENRIVIDEASENNIVLDFISDYDTKQALSAINWLLNDSQNRFLPQNADIISPVITYTTSVITNNLTLDIALYPGNIITKQDFINAAISSVSDARDGSIVTQPQYITILDNMTEISSITNDGNYTINISINDIAGNNTLETINLTVVNMLADIIPPVINTTNAVSGFFINPITLASYGGVFTHNDAKVLCLLSVTDNIDGVLPISGVSVQFLNSSLVVVPTITALDTYSIIFTATDSSANSTILSLSVNVI